jgi:hypothetical protein
VGVLGERETVTGETGTGGDGGWARRGRARIDKTIPVSQPFDRALVKPRRGAGIKPGVSTPGKEAPLVP